MPSEFWLAFEGFFEKRPKSPFIVTAAGTLSYAEVFQRVSEVSEASLAISGHLTENSADSVVRWLAGEKLRNGGQNFALGEVVETSGSTGPPRKFRISEKSQLVTAKAINNEILENREIDELILLPVSHSSGRGRLRAAVLRGAVISIASHPFSFSSLNREFMSTAKYAMAVTPATFRYLALRMGTDFWPWFPGLVSIEFGSASLRDYEVHEIRKSAPRDIALLMHYGLTEASRSFLRDLRFHEWNELGKPLKHVSYRLSQNELVISGPHVARPEDGTVQDESEGEIFTGDLVEETNRGLTLIGRSKNVLNIGGMSISAESLESALIKYRIASDIGIVAGHDNLLGEVPVIFSVGDKNRDVREKWQLVAAQFGLPSRAEFIRTTSLPLIGPGKLDRQSLREEAKNWLARRGNE